MGLSKLFSLLLSLPLTFLSGCSGLGTESVQNNAAAQTAPASVIAYDENDYYSDWTADDYQTIELKSDNMVFSGTGAEVSGTKLTIRSAGTYVVSGTLADGQIVIDAGTDDVVRLVLDNANLYCSTSAPLYAKQAGKLILSLPDGTKNTLSDAASYLYETEGEDEPNAALFSKDDLTINGGGTLTVNANYNNGITSKDDLKIIGSTLAVTAADDAIVGRDRLGIKYGSFTLNAGGDGMKSSNDTDAEKGVLEIEDGIFSITAAADGIQAETTLSIFGGEFEIQTGGGSALAPSKQEAPMVGMPGGGRGGMGGKMPPSDASPGQEAVPEPSAPPTDSSAQQTEDEQTSTKGLKAGGALNIAGGKITADTLDDALHSNGSVTISGGILSLQTGDDGIHADADVLIDGGTIQIAKCYEGIEGDNITINGGSIDLTASDDGINAASGSETDTATPMNGGGRGGMEAGDNLLTIHGGVLVINAQGDGIDSNGSVLQTGGTVVVNGPTNGGNGTLDYGKEYTINGGTLVAAGSSQMNQAPSSSSSQNSVSMTFSETQQAGAAVSLTDSEGKILAVFAPQKTYQSVIVSTPDIQSGGNYTLNRNAVGTGDSTGGYYGANASTAGDAVVSFPIESSVTYVNESGVTTGGMGGGGRGTRPEGNQPPEGVPPQEQTAPGRIQRPESQNGETEQI